LSVPKEVIHYGNGRATAGVCNGSKPEVSLWPDTRRRRRQRLALTAACVDGGLIRERSPVLRKTQQDGQIKIIAAMYDIETAYIALL
jgi:hypothetical protein